jgi:hypothetical protein
MNRVRVMVFNATFNNISAISWRPVLVVEEAGVPGENHAPTMGKQLVNFIACPAPYCGKGPGWLNDLGRWI